MSWQGIWNAILAQIYEEDVLFREIKLEDLDDNHVLCHELRVFGKVLSIVLAGIK